MDAKRGGGALAILPAAGRSRRMGRSKLALPFGNSTVLGSLVQALRGAGVRPIVVVLAPDQEGLRGWAEEAELSVAINPEPQGGMLSSILAGLEALGGAAAVAEILRSRSAWTLISPADLPALRSHTVKELLEAASRSRSQLLVPTFDGKRGHPLVLGPDRILEIPTLDLSIGLRQLVERRADEVTTVPVEDPGVVRDVDTPEDYQRLLRDGMARSSLNLGTEGEVE